MSDNLDTLDTVLRMPLGTAFLLRGRRYKISDSRGWTIGRDYVLAMVWTDQGKERLLRIKETDEIEILES